MRDRFIIGIISGALLASITAAILGLPSLTPSTVNAAQNSWAGGATTSSQLDEIAQAASPFPKDLQASTVTVDESSEQIGPDAGPVRLYAISNSGAGTTLFDADGNRIVLLPNAAGAVRAPQLMLGGLVVQAPLEVRESGQRTSSTVTLLWWQDHSE